MISFNHEHFARYAGTAKHYYEIGQELGQGSEEWQQEGDMFCPQEEKVRMREIYYLLRKCENLPVECILVGWIGEHSGTLWDKVFRATQGILASVSLTN